VTHLRKMMLEELERRNYAQHTTRSYIRTVEGASDAGPGAAAFPQTMLD